MRCHQIITIIDHIHSYDDYLSVHEGTWLQLADLQQLWLLQHVSPFHWVVVTRLRRGFKVSVEGVACIAWHLPLWLMDVAGLASLFAFTHARQMVGQRDVETILIADASLGIWGHYHHGFSPRQTCTQ